MNIATGTFGPFDVCTIREIVEHLDDYREGDAIYVKDVKKLEPETPDLIRSEAITLAELEGSMDFRYLADVDMAREAIAEFGTCDDAEQFGRLLDVIEEYGF